MTVAASSPRALGGAALRSTVVSRSNALTKVGVALLITLALLATVDHVSAGVALGLELLALPFTGVAVRRTLRLFSPVILSAVVAALVTAVIGVDGGALLLALGPLSVTEGSLELGVAIGLRMLAIALPGFALLMTLDPTDLADALGQRLRLPHRFVLGALAGMRLVGVMVAQWHALTLARRARGVGDSGGAASSSRVFVGQAFALLVLAVRRATRLAAAMEGRGFGSRAGRTWARPSTFGRDDVVLMLGGVALVVASVGAAVATGAWSFVLG